MQSLEIDGLQYLHKQRLACITMTPVLEFHLVVKNGSLWRVSELSEIAASYYKLQMASDRVRVEETVICSRNSVSQLEEYITVVDDWP